MTREEYIGNIKPNKFKHKILLTWYDELLRAPVVFCDRGNGDFSLNTKYDWETTECLLSYDEFIDFKRDLPVGALSLDQEAVLHELYWSY